MKRWTFLILATVSLLVLIMAVGQEDVMKVRSSGIHAPDFPSGTAWLNTANPLSLKDLQGKVVLLDFWTYCCINCMHVLPDLDRLEKKYPNELVVIGVHSAKFDTEQDTENIRQAILRYNIHHPVVNDYNFKVWRSYGVRAWPTLALIDPAGYVVGTVSGEGNYEILDRAIAKLIDEASEEGTLNRTPLNLQLEKHQEPERPLSFPGKVLADETTDRLFVADTNHNRILIVERTSGKVLDIPGSGEQGNLNGSFDEASFHQPQGMALVGDRLYVADTSNHLLRALDLTNHTVITVAGTGQQLMGRTPGGPALTTPLSSPWDLVEVDGKIYIAMAGPHQLWVFDPKAGNVEVFAGSGREDITDGPLKSAALAQPSGLTTDDKVIYLADSETSSIRMAQIGNGQALVSTLVGFGLFDFGDQVGSYSRSRFQHPLGVAWHDGYLYVADTYNNRIKRIDLSKDRVEHFAGDGQGSYRDGDAEGARFDEPGGLSVAGGKLYVADTNNHRIRMIDLVTHEVSTYHLQFPERDDKISAAAPVRKLSTDIVNVATGEVELTLVVHLPKGTKPAPDAPQDLQVLPGDGLVLVDPGMIQTNGAVLKNRIRLKLTRPESPLRVQGTVYYCEKNSTVCRVGTVDIEKRFHVGKDAPDAYRLEYSLPKPAGKSAALLPKLK